MGALLAADEPIDYRTADGLAWIALNRPGALNAITPDVLRGLAAALARAETDTEVRALILTGTGKAFSAGADIAWLRGVAPVEVRAFARLAVDVTTRIERCGKVVLAAINGDAVGGGLELAEACMLRLAAPHARLGHPEVRIGALAGFGGTTRLPRLIGKGRAAELLLTGRLVSAVEAERLGLVNRVVPTEQLLPAAEALAREVLAQAPLAVHATWDAIHRGLDLTLEQSALLGAEHFGRLAYTEDFRAGTSAFVQKTRAPFAGK